VPPAPLLAARPPAPAPPSIPPAARRAADALLVATAVAIPLSTSGMQAAVGGLVALSALGAVAGWGVVRRTPLDGVLALFYATLALSTLASGHVLEAGGWARLWVVAAYFATFWWIRDRAHAARLVGVLVAAAAVVSVYGIVQHFTGLDAYRALLGRPTQVHPREAGDSGYAVVGFFRNYLTFAHTMLFPLAWAAALALRRVHLGMVAVPLVVVALVFSTARGAWLAAVAMGAALLAVARPRQAAGTLLVVALTAGAAFAFSPDLRRRGGEMFELGGGNAGRVGIYRANLDVVHDHPVLGLGFGRYRRAAAPYYAAHPTADRRSHAHSNYLHLAAEAGLAGLAAFGLVLATILRRGWPAVARAPDAGAWAAAAGAWVGVVGFCVGGVTQYTFGDNEVALTMWVAVAVLVRCAEETPPSRPG
jgi:putative inorganic carbon (HCO3(-)) transporter